jgi:omega-6 fatty acid desaturase (delta-12 desaturase)
MIPNLQIGAGPAEIEPRQAPPSTLLLTHLKPRNGTGFWYLAWIGGLTSLALVLSSQSAWMIWLLGQLLLSIALLQWFAVLHEAGHNSLFRTAVLNRIVGRLAAYFAVIPYGSWKLVHAGHHRWTGWQDRDLTTATLVPRPLSGLERVVINFCWRTGIPLFSTLYRLNNYWNLVRLRRHFPHRRQRRTLVASIGMVAAAYGLTGYLLGPELFLRLAGLGLVLTLVLQDPLILSQHTHIPSELSNGGPVRPFPPREQEVFTRSLQVPTWFSRLILLNLDSHELHHMYPHVPGYDLHRIDYVPVNRIHWFRWLVLAKRIPADVFLFQNRLQSGFHL